VGACTPVTGADSGGKRTIAWGGRRGAHRWAVYGGGGAGCGGASARHRGARARGGGGRRRSSSHAGRARDVSGDLKEEEAGLLVLEVMSCLSRGRVLDRWGFDVWFSCLQGDANRAAPRASQGAEGGHVRPNQAALVEGVAGVRKHDGDGERGLARRDHGLRAAADNSNCGAVASSGGGAVGARHGRGAASGGGTAGGASRSVAVGNVSRGGVSSPTAAKARLEAAVAVARQEPAATVAQQEASTVE
jgi:hypothetical protein